MQKSTLTGGFHMSSKAYDDISYLDSEMMNISLKKICKITLKNNFPFSENYTI